MRKKNVFFKMVLTGVLVILSLSISYSQDLELMEDIPDGNCLSCQSCSGSYYLCESDEVNAVFDIMDNCGPNSNVSITLIDGC